MDGVSQSMFWWRVERHHGVLRRAEGIAEFGERDFKRRLADGQFPRMHRGIFRAAGSPTTDRQQLVALTWALQGVSGDESSLVLHGVAGYTLETFHVVRPTRSNFTRRLGHLEVDVRRSNFLPEHHLTVVDGIRTTTLARTLCDMSASLSVERLARLVDECKRMKKIEYAEIAACREELRARGRRKTTFLDMVLEDRVAGWVVGESPPEDKVYRWLVDDGYQPVSQHWVVANGKRRRLDLALPDNRVAIEYQGLDSHATTSAVLNDAEKITELQLAGWFAVLVTKKTTRSEFLRNVRGGVRRQGGGGAA